MRAVAAAAALGVGVLLVGLQHPGGPVHGSVATGPTDSARGEPVALRRVFHVGWSADHRRLAITVRARRGCARPAMSARSTAPARLEVTITRPPDQCTGRPVHWHYLLPRPLIAERGQQVSVLIDGQHYFAPDWPAAPF